MGKRKRGKQPKRATEPHPTKTPKGEPPPLSADHPRPLWSFTIFDDYAWGDEEIYRANPFYDIANRLKDYEGRLWNEILVGHRRDHPIPCSKLQLAAQRRLRELNLDIDELWSFHFDGLERLWGLVWRPVFRVLWWDPAHKVYPVKKK